MPTCASFLHDEMLCPTHEPRTVLGSGTYRSPLTFDISTINPGRICFVLSQDFLHHAHLGLIYQKPLAIEAPSPLRLASSSPEWLPPYPASPSSPPSPRTIKTLSPSSTRAPVVPSHTAILHAMSPEQRPVSSRPRARTMFAANVSLSSSKTAMTMWVCVFGIDEGSLKWHAPVR